MSDLQSTLDRAKIAVTDAAAFLINLSPNSNSPAFAKSIKLGANFYYLEAAISSAIDLLEDLRDSDTVPREIRESARFVLRGEREPAPASGLDDAPETTDEELAIRNGDGDYDGGPGEERIQTGGVADELDANPFE